MDQVFLNQEQLNCSQSLRLNPFIFKKPSEKGKDSEGMIAGT